MSAPGGPVAVRRRRLAVLAVALAVALTAWWALRGGSAAPASAKAPVTIRLAFAGDVHFEGSSAAALTRGLGSGAAPLRRADLSVVNLETAVTDRGTPAAKQYTFRAPPRALSVLKAAGIDAVSVANNHGMDYGSSGLADTLAAGRAAGLSVIGAGADERAAFAGLVRTIRGVRVAVIAATDVLDSSVAADWTAGAGHAGLASAKDGDRFAARVRQAGATADVVVAFVHWGVEQQRCPTARQVALARQLVAAGADVVVGSHAHVLQPLASVHGAPVAYGLGNFVFYGKSGPAVRSGVLEVDVRATPGSGAGGHPAATTRWDPATIVSGRPVAVRPAPANALPAVTGC